MSLEERMYKLEQDVLPRLEGAVEKLSETAIVVSNIQARQANVLKGNTEWLEEHEKRMAKLETQIAQSRLETDERIKSLVIAIGELLRSNGGQAPR